MPSSKRSGVKRGDESERTKGKEGDEGVGRRGEGGVRRRWQVRLALLLRPTVFEFAGDLEDTRKEMSLLMCGRQTMCQGSHRAQTLVARSTRRQCAEAHSGQRTVQPCNHWWE